MALNIKINYKLLAELVEPEIERRTINIAREMAKDYFEEQKQKFIKAFENDAVSQELLQENNIFISDYISGGGTEKYGGNLYSFFGFDKNEENPVLKLVDELEDSFHISTQTRLTNGKYYPFKIIGPTLETIDAATKLPWINRSWIKAVENGLSNVKNYIRILNGSEFSLSEEGLQIKNTMSKTFKNKRYYFTDRYKNFVSRLKG